MSDPKTPLSPPSSECSSKTGRAVLDAFSLKPLGWVLLNRNGEVTPWKHEVLFHDPSEGGYASFPALADELNENLAPHRWAQIVALPKEGA